MTADASWGRGGGARATALPEFTGTYNFYGLHRALPVTQNGILHANPTASQTSRFRDPFPGVNRQEGKP